MANSTTYYWRIDEKNAGGTTTGVVWSFTTAAGGVTYDYYVDGVNGNDNNPGTESQPFKTIGKASTVATAGKSVLVKPATYNEQVTVRNAGTSTSPITFKADTSGEVIVNATNKNYGFYAYNKPWIVIDGFTVRNSKFVGISFRSNAAHGIAKNCKIYSNTNSGVYADAADYITVENCLIYNNGSLGIRADSGATDLTARNCTVYGNGTGIQVPSSSIIDCINGSGNSITYSDVWGNATNYAGGAAAGTGCISSDPLFVNPAGSDFHLQTGSPCIGTASDGGNMGYEY
jgi:hypothetical protein